MIGLKIYFQTFLHFAVNAATNIFSIREKATEAISAASVAVKTAFGRNDRI